MLVKFNQGEIFSSVSYCRCLQCFISSYTLRIFQFQGFQNFRSIKHPSSQQKDFTTDWKMQCKKTWVMQNLITLFLIDADAFEKAKGVFFCINHYRCWLGFENSPGKNHVIQEGRRANEILWNDGNDGVFHLQETENLISLCVSGNGVKMKIFTWVVPLSPFYQCRLFCYKNELGGTWQLLRFFLSTLKEE